MSAFPPSPQQPQKSGPSKGLIILVAALFVGVGGILLVVALGVAGYLYYSSRSGEGGAPVAAGGSAPSTSSSKPSAERPSPTAAQSAALAGGQTATWPGQGLSWTLPPDWTLQNEEKLTLVWRSPGTWEAASLIVSISPMSNDFPTETSLQAYYDQTMQRIARAEVTEAKWLELDGVRGVMWREASPESEDDPQRLQWLGYRSYLGETQLVNIMLASRGEDAATHEDAMYGILYSTKIPH